MFYFRKLIKKKIQGIMGEPLNSGHYYTCILNLKAMMNHCVLKAGHSTLEKLCK